jgi:putative tricarboxylic transport membrane protein
MKFREHGFDWIALALLLLVPIVVFWQISTSLVEQGVASGGPQNNAAIFPRIVAWLMVGLSGVRLLQLLAGRVSTPSPIEGTPTTPLALLSTAMLLAYLILLSTLGYYLATPVLIAALLRLYGLRLIESIIGGLAMTLVVAGIFEGLLNVVLPLGFSKFTLFG